MKKIWLGLSFAAVTVSGCMIDEGDEELLGSTEQDVAVTWTNTVGVAAVGNNLTKTGAAPWNAGAVSVNTIAGDGYAEFSTSETTTAKMAGLSTGDTDQHYSDIAFAVQLQKGGKIGVYEAGVQIAGSFGTYVAGDVIRVENTGGVITYSKNGTLFYTSLATATGPLLIDTSMLTTGGTLTNVVLVSSQVNFQNVVGVSVSGNSLTKTGAPPWNAGASSVETILGNGYVEFTTAENNGAKMCGLNTNDTTPNYIDIDYALSLKSNHLIGVYENGVQRPGNFGSYIAGDVFRVDVTAGVVTYRKNGATFYTSLVPPTFPLRVDTSLRTTGATINNVTLFPF